MKLFIYNLYERAVTYLGDLMLATKPPATKAKHILEMMAYLKPGNVICRYYTYYLDSIIIPGEFTHSGMVLDRDLIAHSVSEGVSGIHPIDFVKDTDGFVVLEPPYPNWALLNRALDRAKWHLDNKTEYDFTFSDPKKLYCHEFTVECLAEGGIGDIKMVKRKFGVFPFSFTKKLYLADGIISRCKVDYVFRG